MSKTELEHAITEAAKRMASWTANAKKIEQQIAAAKGRIATADDQRKQFALAASLGDPKAIGDLAKGRADHAAAIGDLADLGQAMQDAAAKLIEAEAEAKKANRALAKFEAEVLMHKRVHLAGKIDGVIAEFAQLFAEFEALGAEILNKDTAPPNLHGISNHDAAIGWRRVAAAMPPFVQKLYPGSHHDEMKKQPLAISELQIWNLPEQPEKARAA